MGLGFYLKVMSIQRKNGEEVLKVKCKVAELYTGKVLNSKTPLIGALSNIAFTLQPTDRDL